MIKNIYSNLEQSMLSIEDYASVPVEDNEEQFVTLGGIDGLTATQRGKDMLPYTGNLVYVRSGVAKRLSEAANLLLAIDDSLSLDVTYGYRALQVQTKNFEKQKQRLSTQFSGEALDMAAHRLVARPDVAGHPTGGAVDIQITKTKVPLDFGTSVGEFVEDSYTYSPYIGIEAMQGRMLLRSVMMSAGFAPFDGEWWHFSYGDKEWARYCKQPAALYDQCNFTKDMLANEGEICEND